MLDVEVVGDVQQLAGLLGHGRLESRVPVSQTVHGDAAKEVQVLTTVVGNGVHAVTAHELHGRAAERVHHIGVVKLLGIV